MLMLASSIHPSIHLYTKEKRGGEESNVLRSNPNIQPVNYDLFPLAILIVTRRSVRRCCCTCCVSPNRIQRRDRDQIMLEDNEFALLAVVVQYRRAGVEGCQGARLVVGEEDEGGCLRGCTEGFHCFVGG